MGGVSKKVSFSSKIQVQHAQHPLIHRLRTPLHRMRFAECNGITVWRTMEGHNKKTVADTVAWKTRSDALRFICMCWPVFSLSTTSSPNTEALQVFRVTLSQVSPNRLRTPMTQPGHRFDRRASSGCFQWNRTARLE